MAQAIGTDRARRGPMRETPLTRYATALTALKSSAELLRDVADLDAGTRARLLGVVLDEVARLEQLLRELRLRAERSA